MTAATFAVTALVGGLANAATVDFEDNLDNVYFLTPIFSDGFTATSNVEGALGTNYAIVGYGVTNGIIHLDAWANSSSDSVWTSFNFGHGYSDGTQSVVSLSLTGTTDAGTVTQTIKPAVRPFRLI